MGQTDGFGALNPRWNLGTEMTVSGARHHTHAELPLHLPVTVTLRKLPGAAERQRSGPRGRSRGAAWPRRQRTQAAPPDALVERCRLDGKRHGGARPMHLNRVPPGRGTATACSRTRAKRRRIGANGSAARMGMVEGGLPVRAPSAGMPSDLRLAWPMRSTSASG